MQKPSHRQFSPPLLLFATNCCALFYLYSLLVAMLPSLFVSIGLAKAPFGSLMSCHDFYVLLCIRCTDLILYYCSIWTPMYIVDILGNYSSWLSFLSNYFSAIRSFIIHQLLLLQVFSLMLLLQEVFYLLLTLRISQNLLHWVWGSLRTFTSTEFGMSNILILSKDIYLTFHTIFM